MSELGSAEAKMLLAGLMEGMVEARAKVWELESHVQKKACAEEGLRIDKTRLERRLSESARGFEQKVVDLKCQHQQDLMILVRSGVGPSTSMTTAGKVRMRTTTRAAATEVLSQADSKSEEDEMEIESEKERDKEEEEEEDREDQVAKRQFEALVAQNDSLEARCQELAGSLDRATEARQKLEREAQAAHREARELREALEALRAAENKTKQQCGKGGAMEELLEAWAELGISEERRKSLLDKVTQAPSNVCQNLLEEARRQRAQVKSQVVELRKELAVLAWLLDGKAVEEEQEEEGEEGDTHQNTEEALVMLRDKLLVLHVQATSVLQERLQQARRLVQEAEKLQRSVGGKPRPALADLLRLRALLMVSAEEEKEVTMEEAVEEEVRQESLDMVKVAEAAADAGRGIGRAVLLTVEKLQEWEGEIKAMRRERSAMVLELQGLLEQGHGACSLMNMSVQSLKDTIQAILEQGKHQKQPLPSPQSPHQHPYAPSPSPPAGSSPRMVILESPLPHRRSSIAPPPASVVSWESPSLQKMVVILTSGGGGATVAGLWAAEDQAVSLADAIPQARFLVDVLVECWNRRRELLVLCLSTADAVKNCVVGEGLKGLAERVCLTLPEADSEEGDVQNGGLSAEEAESFVAGLNALLVGVEEKGRATLATLEGIWDLLRVPIKDRNIVLALRSSGRAAAAPTAPVAPAGEHLQQHADGTTGSEGRGQDVAVAFRRLQADLERTQVNSRGRLEVEEWIGQVLERIHQQVQALQSGLETLDVQQELMRVLKERRRRYEGILKLNDDIMGLEGRARLFETEASDRTRLVDRKTNSVRLLKEEKFRKDSKNRFARLLERLRQELEEWKAQEGVAFDQDLLGEDIQRALSHSVESGGRSWVEGRTELMHLHTSQPKSRNSSPNQLSLPLQVEEEVVAAAVPPQAPPPMKRDPFARVLSPTAITVKLSTTEPLTPEGPSEAAAAITAAAAPRDGRGMGGGLLGLNRLTGAGASVSDLLVRGKHIQNSTAPHAPDGIHSKKRRKGAGGSGTSCSGSSSSSSSSSDTGGPACCRRGTRGEENVAKN